MLQEKMSRLIQGLIQGVVGQFVNQDIAIDVFKTGREGPGASIMSVVSVGQNDFRPAYATHLLEEWIPALEGVEEKLGTEQK